MSALLDAVRQKYPQYADKSDDELALAIGSKYPTYLDRDADFKKEFTASRIQAEMALKPSPKPDLGQPFAEVQPGDRVIQRMPGNDPERNRAELAKAFQPLLPQTSDEDRMRANLKQMSLAEDVSPTPKAEIAETLSKPYQPPNKTLAGVVKGVEGLAEGFTSPVGIATLGMGALPRAAQKVVSLAFAAQMVKQVPELAAQLGTEFGKPPEQRDQQKIAQLITEGAGTVGFTTLAAKHGLAPQPATKPMQGPLPNGSVLQMPKGANPLATIGDHLEAKGIELPSGKPVAAPEAPKPPQTPPAPEKQPISQPSTVSEALRKSGYDVKAWDMPGMGKQLQVTSPEAGAAKGMTVYVPETATLEEVTQRLEQKRKEFEAANEAKNKAAQPSTVQPPRSSEAPNLVSSKAEPTVTSKPAKAETTVTPAVTQVGLGPSMGAMTPSDPLETASGEAGDPDVYGVAERVRSKRAKSGQVEAVPLGEGTTAPDSVEHGRELLGSGADAEASMTEFERTKKMSSNDMALARAKGEELAQSARKIEEQSGTDSPEYKAAKKALSDWDKRSKAMQTEWHKTGMAQQGETDLDTGSFTGLVREFESQTGKEITPKQAQEAKEAAGRVRKAQTELEESSANLQEHLAEQSGTGAEKRALRAANKVVREAAVRLAKAEGKTRVAKTVNERATAKVQEDAERKALQAAQDVARNAAIKMAKADTQSRVTETQDTRYIQDKQAQKALQAANEVARKAAVDVAEAENKARTEKAVTQRKQAQVQLKAAKAALEAANKAVRMAAIKAAKAEAENRAHPERRVWERVSDYLNQGGKSFDEIRNRVAADLGLRVKQVTDIITRSPRAKYLADDVWRKQQQLRRFQQGARLWLKQAQTPGYLRAISRVPRGLFNLKVGLHGTVALGTHAPMVAFQPAFWKVYVENFGKMYRMVGSPGYYEMQVQDLLRRKNYITAKRAGLQNDPYQYEDFTSPAVSQYFGRITGMGNRGYSVLKMLRQDLFDQQWESLPKTAQIPEVAKAIADGLNHATGVTKASAPGGASVALFAPRLEASRVAWLAVDPVIAGKTFANWKNATAGEKRFAINQVKEKAWVVGTMMSLLAINQGILSVTDSKQKVNFTDPTRSDFLKFKVAGMNVSYGNAMVTMARLPPRLYEIHASSGGKLKNLIHPDQSTYDLIGEYFRSQESPATSLGTTLWFKADFENRPLPNSNRAVPKWLRAQGIGPYTWPEFWSEQMLPIPAEDFAREVWKNGLGMSDEQVKSAAKALAVISIMAGTGGRISDDYNLKK